MTTDADIHRSINAVWRIESARIIGALARMVRDVGVAEELAQDALVAALEQWPQGGIPDNPAAWLMAAAKHRALDLLRRRKLHASKEQYCSDRVFSFRIHAHRSFDGGGRWRERARRYRQGLTLPI